MSETIASEQDTRDWVEWPVEGWPGTIRYRPSVLDEIAENMAAGFRRNSWGGVETGGVLFGNCDGSSYFIAGHRPIDCEHSNGPSYELSERDRAGANKIIETLRAEGLVPVGWYKSVSHRDLEVTEADRNLWDAIFVSGILLMLKRSKEGVRHGTTFCRDNGQTWAGHCTLEELPPAPPPPDIAVIAPAAAPAAELLPDPSPESVPHVDAFALSPDPEFFYPSPQHREALASLEYSIRNAKGFVMLVGEVGMGKTMVLECLSDRLKAAGIEYGFLFNSRISRYELFELLTIDFDLKPASTTKTAVLMALNHHLLRRANLGQITALLIDDAQKMSGEVLEEIELLSNLETRKGKLLQVVMAARPEFETRMNQPEFAGLRQRFVLRPRLGPLSVAETAEYIRTRLERAGESDAAAILPVEEIHRLSKGVPRLISAICGQLVGRRGLDSANLPQALMEVSEELGLIA